MHSNITSAMSPASSVRGPDAEAIEESAGLAFDRAFEQGGPCRANVMVAFEGLLASLPRHSEREDRLRDVAKAAVLSTARSHGNMIETGRILLGNIDELGERLAMDVRRCKDQVMLGLAEGACQIGPIIYGRFLDIASEYRDNADDWIAKNKRRPVTFDPSDLPVIVPFEAELTLSIKPFKEPEPAIEAPTATSPQEQATEPPPPSEWSRPKGKGFFKRLSDVMGNLFSRG